MCVTDTGVKWGQSTRKGVMEVILSGVMEVILSGQRAHSIQSKDIPNTVIIAL